eukprot:SAG31_NODE_3163_length_4605_cov_15.046383_6_plen_48_part_00
MPGLIPRPDAGVFRQYVLGGIRRLKLHVGRPSLRLTLRPPPLPPQFL